MACCGSQSCKDNREELLNFLRCPHLHWSKQPTSILPFITDKVEFGDSPPDDLQPSRSWPAVILLQLGLRRTLGPQLMAKLTILYETWHIITFVVYTYYFSYSSIGCFGRAVVANCRWRHNCTQSEYWVWSDWRYSNTGTKKENEDGLFVSDYDLVVDEVALIRSCQLAWPEILRQGVC